MKNKILSIALVLGMMLSLLSITPVSATDITSANALPYFFNDFEDEISVATGDDVSIVDGGIGGSGKCLKITDENPWVSGTGGYKDRPIRDKDGNKLVGNIVGGSTVVFSFYIKIPQKLTKGDVLFWVDTDDGNKYPIATFDKANTSDWQKVTVSEVMKDTVTKIEELKFRFGSHGDSTDLIEGDATKALPREFYIDDFEIAVYKKGLIKADQISNMSGYYMGFESGSGSVSVMDGGYWNIGSTLRTVGNRTYQVTESPTDNGKALKITMGDTDGWDLGMRITSKTSSGQWDGNSTPATVIPKNATLTLTFKYYWAQEMSSETNPGFSIATTNGDFSMTGATFDTTANQWNTATLIYTNDTGATIDLSSKALWIRFYRMGEEGTVWKKAKLASGETKNGARTVYLDDFSGKIVAAGETETPDAVAPLTRDLQVNGDFVEGNTVEFSQRFMPGDGVSADASIVKLVNTDAKGNKGTLAYCSINSEMTVPELPKGGTLSFELLPMDVSGSIGSVISYGYIDVVGFMAEIESLTFAGDGSATAKVNIQNRKHDGSDVNAVLVLLLYDEGGALVDYVEKAVLCENGDDILSTNATYGQLKFTPDLTNKPEHAEIKSAEAYLWDCGEATPSFATTTMTEIASDKSATK